MSALIELKNITAGYDSQPVLRNIHLSIGERDFLGITGPNGGGKTTLLKVILGLLAPFSGEVIYSASKQNLFGYLPQNSHFDTRFPICVTEVVLSGLMSGKKLFRRYSQEDVQLAHQLLEQYGMGAYKNSPIGELSGGQIQRVFLCRAIISSPRLLILDEPTTYVDHHFEQEFYSILRELNQTIGVVMVSHDQAAIRTHARQIIHVNRGIEHV